MKSEAEFAARLRWWRRRRGWSQLELAGRAEISQRHLSFLEVGRASPSREMVARLAASLDLPLRQHNELLVAAGFAPVWRQSDLAAPQLSGVRAALDHMLAQQEPFPAVVIDRRWNLLRANQGAVRLVEFLVGLLPPDAPVNLADALVGPDVLRPFLVNWKEVARYFIRSVEADAAADGTAETAALLERLLSYPGVRPLLREGTVAAVADCVLPMNFCKAEFSLELFTTITTLGTPQDVTLQELRIESFFPTQESTAAIFRAWASPTLSSGPAAMASVEREAARRLARLGGSEPSLEPIPRRRPKRA
ncbi:MAG TPA: helix-turn-helix domain-containing protein [Stellaceae bacterium]|jgi:transcriptional regulator with XRE-family HTH domain